MNPGADIARLPSFAEHMPKIVHSLIRPDEHRAGADRPATSQALDRLLGNLGIGMAFQTSPCIVLRKEDATVQF